jgi:hypothetical protein
LTEESRQVYRSVDLTFRDLRREFGSLLLESGAALHDIASFLGHAAVTTTNRYLQSAPVRLERALTRLELTGAGFAHDSHKQAPEAPSEPPNPLIETAANLLN